MSAYLLSISGTNILRVQIHCTLQLFEISVLISVDPKINYLEKRKLEFFY
jgi:hypothetical protein